MGLSKKTIAKRINVSDTASLTTQDTFHVNPADVKPGRNSRMIEAADYMDRVVDRAISIYKRGQLQPVEARREGDKSLTLTLGFTRRDAVIMLRNGFTAIDPDTGEETFFQNKEALLWVAVTDCDVDQAFLRGIAENLERNDTTDLQEALAQQEIRTTMGWCDAQIARFYGYTNQNRVMHLNKLVCLPEDVQQKVHKKQLALHAALLTEGLGDDERKAVIDACADGKGKVDGAALKAMIRDLIGGKAETSAESEETPEEATEEGGEEAEAKPKKKASASLKRSVKEFAGFAHDMGDTSGVKDSVKNLFNTLVLWFANEKTDKQLWNAIDKL